MQSKMPTQSCARAFHPVAPRAARAAPSSANGSANSVWLNLIMPRMSDRRRAQEVSMGRLNQLEKK
jgi:hypothetical protein